jgi:CubicO group peptidase (beta-lactamase class C family)
MTARVALAVALALGAALPAAAAEGRAPSTPYEALAARARQAVDEGRAVGVSIAVLRDGRIDWTYAHGAANAWLGIPLAPDTPMPAASLGKPVAALAALRAVARGELALDAPLPLAGDAIDGDGAITLRQVLTHTAGLSNFLGERVHRRRGGASPTFRYSGVGFLLLQDALAASAGSGFAAIAARDVFEPLQMNASSFDRATLRRAAAPHLALKDALIPGTIGLALTWPVLLVLGAVARRWRHGAWALRPRDAGAALLVASVACALFLFERSGSARAALFFTAVPLAPAAALLGAWAAARRLRAPAWRWSVGVAWVALIAAAVGSGRNAALPVPELGARRISAAASLHATPADLARLLIELRQPTLDAGAPARAMTAAAQAIGNGTAWGLGIGIVASARGPVAWHRGSAPGAQGLMAIALDSGEGVVVLANGGAARATVDAIAERVLGMRFGLD